MTLLSEVANIIMGQSPPSSTYNEEGKGLPFFQGKTDFGFYSPIPRKYCTEPKKIAEPGDILISVRAPVGPTNVCTERSCIGRGLAAIRAKHIDSTFLLFNIKFFENYIASLGTGSTFQAINKTLLSTVEVNKEDFPLPEQRKIAYILSTVQQAIEQQERLITLTTELKKTLMHTLFTAGLRGEPQKDTEIGTVPESWEIVPLEKCCDVVDSSISYTDFLAMPDSEGDNSVLAMGIKVSDMNTPGNENKITIANLMKNVTLEFAKRKLVSPNVVVFPKRGAAIATNKKRLTTAWTVLDPNLIGVKARPNLNCEFLYYWFQTFDLRKITDPGTTPQLNKKDLRPILIPIPSSTEEQSEIVTIFRNIERKIELHRQKYLSLSDLFRTLLHQLMTAQIRVHELEENV